MPNKHEFKARLVCSFLRIILNGKIIDYRLPNLLRETSLIGNNSSFDKLKRVLQQYTRTEADLLKMIIAFREEENKDVKIKPEKKESKLHPEEALREKEKAYPVNSYFWSEVVKYLVQNGRILKLSDVLVKPAVHILLQQLKQIQLELLACKQPLNTSDVQEIFLAFIGQLCQLEKMDAAEVIHNFLHFGFKTAEQHLHDPSFAENFAVGLAGPLCDALELTGRISDGEKMGDLKLKSVSTEAADYKFFTKLTTILMQHTIFKKPFDKVLYKKWKQNTELFARESEVQAQLEMMSLKSSLPVLQEALRSLHINSDKEAESSNELLNMLLFSPQIASLVPTYHKPLPPLPASAGLKGVISEIKRDEPALDSASSERSFP